MEGYVYCLLYIEGDNLDVLKCLKETYLHKVKMIYIDPPYNTGNDFVYEDDFAQSALRELERDGLILRREYLEVPVRVEYAPTEDCRRLLPILEQLSDWAEARMPADGSTTKKEEPQ